jgi:hypothetical protein
MSERVEGPLLVAILILQVVDTVLSLWSRWQR